MILAISRNNVETPRLLRISRDDSRTTISAENVASLQASLKQSTFHGSRNCAPQTDLEGLRLLRDRGRWIAFRRTLPVAELYRFSQSGRTVRGVSDAVVGALWPQLHAHIGCAVPRLRHVEFFHDHNRIDRILFEARSKPQKGRLYSDRSRPGHGNGIRSGGRAPLSHLKRCAIQIHAA
jgi:hypothetical protein